MSLDWAICPSFNPHDDRYDKPCLPTASKDVYYQVIAVPGDRGMLENGKSVQSILMDRKSVFDGNMDYLSGELTGEPMTRDAESGHWLIKE